MTPEQLLTPRIKVIAPYPASPYNVGDILIFWEIPQGYDESKRPITIDLQEISGGEVYRMADEEEFKKYPHLFKPLQWWEKRKKEDMPVYVKCLKSPDQIIEPGSVLKVKWNDHGGKVEKGPWIFPYTNCFEPATHEEYLTYINSK